jgi:hypothetical protein
MSNKQRVGGRDKKRKDRLKSKFLLEKGGQQTKKQRFFNGI